MALIYGNIRKSKQKKLPKKQAAEYEAWLAKHNVTPKSRKKTFEPLTGYLPITRETPKYNSVGTGGGIAAKPEQKIYTGDKMIGIGTLHKSNAVPVFTTEDAHDLAIMRR
jgi:hypothetical protein